MTYDGIDILGNTDIENDEITLIPFSDYIKEL